MDRCKKSMELPSLIRDKIYRNGRVHDTHRHYDVGVSRTVADRVYYRAMRDCGVGRVEAAIRYVAARCFGAARWGGDYHYEIHRTGDLY
jgi:hypothetical protein